MKLAAFLVLSKVRLEVALCRHGWTLAAAPLAMLLSVVAYLAWLAPAQEALAATRSELELQRKATTALPLATPATERDRLDRLKEVLVPESSAADVVKHMAALAQGEGIAILQADYQQQAHGAAPVVQLQINQPVRASYAQLRAYIESVLREMPNVSLDHVSARRDNIGQHQLEVRLRWSVWLDRRTDRSPPPRRGA